MNDKLMKRCLSAARIVYRPRRYQFSTGPLVRQQEEANDDSYAAVRVRSLMSNARTLLRARRSQEASKVIDEGLKLEPWNGSLHFWKLASKLGSANAVLDAWSTMLKLGIRPQPEHYDILSQALFLSDDARHLLFEHFQDMQAQGILGNLKFYQNLLVALNRDTSLDALLQVMQTMRADAKFREYTRDVTIMRMFAQAEDRLFKAGKLDPPPVPGLDDSSNLAPLASGAVKTISTEPEVAFKGLSSFSAQQVHELVSPYWPADADQEGAHEAWKQAREVVRKDPEPTLDAYHMLLRRADLMTSSNDVLDVLDEMDEMGVVTTPFTQRLAISSLLRRNDTNSALQIAQQMEQKDGQLDPIVLVNLIKDLCRSNQHEEALTLLHDSLRESRVDLSVSDASLRIYNTAIEGMMNGGRVADAEMLMEEMFASCQPSIKTWHIMVDGYLKAGSIVDAAKAFGVVLDQPLLRSRSGTADSRIDTMIASLVEAYLENDMYHEAERLVSQCVADNSWRGTNTKIWRHFIAYLCQADVDRLEEAWDLFRFQKAKLVAAQQKNLYRDMLEYACFGRNDSAGALALLAEVKELGLDFEQHDLASLMHLAMHNGDRALAEQLCKDAKTRIETRGEPMGSKLKSTMAMWSLS